MPLKSITASPSQIMVEQLAASGVKYVFYNSGSREARFFDALQTHPDIHGILSLHEGSVASMAGGYAQASGEPAVMVVHLGAGLAQCMGQLYNVWSSGLPVVVITFAADTGSFADKVTLDLSHNVGPTSIAAPLTKANWTVIEPEGLPQAIERALRVAKTAPTGPVHLAVYDRLLDDRQITTNLIEGPLPDTRASTPDDADLAAIFRTLQTAERPLFYIGDGIWKGDATAQATAFAEHFGLPVVASWDDVRSMDRNHPLHMGRIDQAVNIMNPDVIFCLGVYHRGQGRASDLQMFAGASKVIAVGPSEDRFRNIPGLDTAILADERKTLDHLLAMAQSETQASDFDERRAWVQKHASAVRQQRLDAMAKIGQPDRVHPVSLANAIERTLVARGGGQLMAEQYAVPLDCMDEVRESGVITVFRTSGASEGWGVGATIGTKLGAPDQPVIGLVGDGSLYFADSGIWSAAHHGIPVLYVISNNQSYGVVAGAFGRAGGAMKHTGEYSGVVLSSPDPVKIAAGFGIEGVIVSDEAKLDEAIAHGMDIVETERRPYLLDVRLPLGVPEGGRAAKPFCLSERL